MFKRHQTLKIFTAFICAVSILSGCSQKDTSVNYISEYNDEMFQHLSEYQEKSLERPAEKEESMNHIYIETEDDENDIIYKGTVFDTFGVPLSYTVEKEIGFFSHEYNEEYCECFSNVLSSYSNGLETSFYDILSAKNPKPVDGNFNIGKSVQITYNARTQKEIYEYLKSMNIIGCAVVMRTDGSIVAEVSYPSFNANNYKKSLDENKDIASDSNFQNGCFNNYAEMKRAPGSTFKMISRVLADVENIGTLWDDNHWATDGSGSFYVNDWYYDEKTGISSYPPQNRNASNAFIVSSNVYFAKAFKEIGASRVQELAKKYFKFGEPILLDFTTLNNNILGIDDQNLDMLCRAGYGQGKVETTPVYLAMLVREVIFGDMVKAFAKQNVVDTSDYTNILEEGSERNDIIASISDLNLEDDEGNKVNIKTEMTQIANDAGFNFENYTLACKTGTTQFDYNQNTLYIAGYLERENNSFDIKKIYQNYQDYDKENGSYIIVLQAQYPEDIVNFDRECNYATDIMPIYQHIANLVVETNGQ